MTTAFGYIRVSTPKQGEGVSLEAQQDAIRSCAARNDLTITNWFEEQQSAAKQGRPVFADMLRRLRRHEAQALVFYGIDRSARNLGDWSVVSDLLDQGIDVHIATENIDLRSRGGRLTADMLAVIATDFSRNNRLEVKKGQKGRLKQGLFPFCAPLGYCNNGKGQLKTIDPIKGPLVRELFERYATGEYSIRTLIETMNERGLRNKYGLQMKKSGMEAILNNPFYCGLIDLSTHDDVYQGGHEPLISVTLYETVQAQKAGKSGKKVTKHAHRLRGLFTCASCGKAMIGERQKGRYTYYRCHQCSGNCVREGDLDTAIHALLRRIALTDTQVAQLTAAAADWNQRYEHDAAAEADQHRLQTAQLDTRLERLTDALLDGDIDRASFKARKAGLMRERRALKEQLDSTSKHPSAAMLADWLELIKSLHLHYEIANPTEQRQILKWASSNRRVDRKNVLLEPSKWLAETESALGVCFGAQTPPSSRRPSDSQIERLMDCCRRAEEGRSSTEDTAL